MSIFQKDCPECAAPNSVNATTCRCGYHFDPQAASDDESAEYAQQQDKLYRDYLAARIAQAEAELIVAREFAKADPENTYKASGALLAEQALNTLQAEMKQLSLRISAAPPPRSRPAPVRPAPQPAKPVMAKPAAVAKPAPPKPATTAIARIETMPKAQPAPRPAPIQHQPPKQEPQKPKITNGIRRKPVPSPTAAPRVAAPAPVATVHELRMPARAPMPQPTAKPDESFRRAQAQKAEAIARSKMAAAARQEPVLKPRAVKPAAPKPIAERPPADIPPLVLAPVAASKTAMQDCPNCTARVAADAQRCGCGYTFARASGQVPALTLDATALAILTEGIASLDPNRRR